MKPLDGLTIVSFESRHAKTMADLIRLQGGTPFEAPSMKEVTLEGNQHVFEFAEKLLAGKVDVLILLTGVGTKALVNVLEARYSKDTILEAFRKTTIVPRGPKPIRVLKEWGIPYALTVPEPNTWRELLETMDKGVGAQLIAPMNGKKVYVQEYGVTNAELTEGLEKRGAQVVVVPVYKWALPDNLEPLKEAVRMITSRKVQGAFFTTSVQIKHVLQVAEKMGVAAESLRDAFKKIVVASIGPDCSETMRACGVPPDLEPEQTKMANLVQEMAIKAKSVLETKK